MILCTDKIKEFKAIPGQGIYQTKDMQFMSLDRNVCYIKVTDNPYSKAEISILKDGQPFYMGEMEYIEGAMYKQLTSDLMLPGKYTFDIKFICPENENVINWMNGGSYEILDNEYLK